MAKHHKIWILILLTGIISCNNQADRKKSAFSFFKSECKPYFNYDKVEHYYFNISEDEIFKIEEKQKKSDKEIKQMKLLIQYTPDKISDTSVLKDIDKIGFVKNDIAKYKFEQIDEIFCERKHKEGIVTACMAIYRDIFIFKQQNKIVGIAKVCFECGDNVILGTTRNTDDFGQSGDYDKLYRLVH